MGELLEVQQKGGIVSRSTVGCVCNLQLPFETPSFYGLWVCAGFLRGISDG